MMRFGDEEILINEPTKPTTNQRPNPVDPVIGPVPGDQGRPKGPCWVHGGPSEVPTGNSVGPNEKSSKSWAQPINSSPVGVHNGTIDCEQQGESKDNLPYYSLELAYTSQRMDWNTLSYEETKKQKQKQKQKVQIKIEIR